MTASLQSWPRSLRRQTSASHTTANLLQPESPKKNQDCICLKKKKRAGSRSIQIQIPSATSKKTCRAYIGYRFQQSARFPRKRSSLFYYRRFLGKSRAYGRSEISKRYSLQLTRNPIKSDCGYMQSTQRSPLTLEPSTGDRMKSMPISRLRRPCPMWPRICSETPRKSAQISTLKNRE